MFLCGLQPIKDGELPPYDAMESILPEYQYIFNDPNATQPGTDRTGRTKHAVPPATNTTVPATRNTRWGSRGRGAGWGHWGGGGTGVLMGAWGDGGGVGVDC